MAPLAGLLLGAHEILNDRLSGAKNTKRRGQMAVDYRVPLFIAHVLNHAVPGIAGVIDNNIHPPVAVYRSTHKPFAEVSGGNVASADHGLSAERLDLFSYLFSFFLIKI